MPRRDSILHPKYEVVLRSDSINQPLKKSIIAAEITTDIFLN